MLGLKTGFTKVSNETYNARNIISCQKTNYPNNWNNTILKTSPINMTLLKKKYFITFSQNGRSRLSTAFTCIGYGSGPAYIGNI